MTPTQFKVLIALYITNFIFFLPVLWMEYLDIRTTVKNLRRGAIELNSTLPQTAATASFNSELWGKIKDGAWVYPLALLCPIAFPAFIWKAWDMWTKAVHVNERVAGTLGKLGK